MVALYSEFSEVLAPYRRNLLRSWYTWLNGFLITSSPSSVRTTRKQDNDSCLCVVDFDSYPVSRKDTLFH